MVNQVMQTASTIASFGLSAGFPASSRIPTDGIVLTVMPAVDTTTNVIEIILTIWNINKTGHHSSMVNTAACYQWGPRLESSRGEWLILNRTELLIWICSQWVCVCVFCSYWMVPTFSTRRKRLFMYPNQKNIRRKTARTFITRTMPIV